MGAVHGGLGTGGESGLDEALHFGWVCEGEGLTGLESDKHVVGVDVCCAELSKRSAGWRWCGCGSGSRSWCGSRSRCVGSADRWLS